MQITREKEGGKKRDSERDGVGRLTHPQPFSKPLMYVIDLLCDALALRHQIGYSSAEGGGVEDEEWKELDGKGNRAREKSVNGKWISAASLISSLRH